MTPEITFKDFAEVAKRRGHNAESLAQRFRGVIDEPREFFERVMTCKWHGEDRSYVVIPFRSVIQFYQEELHYLKDSRPNQRVCACGCRQPIFGRQKWFNQACRKRIQRQTSVTVKTQTRK